MVRMVLLLSCFLFISQSRSIGTVVSWNESHRLSWSDFRQVPNLQSNAVAITASGITFGFSVKTSGNQNISFTTEVHAHFYPEESWVKPELANSHILEHEQLHFDITELYARKFRKSIVQLKVSNRIESELKKLHKTIIKASETMQNDYDNETDYSRNKERQATWKLLVNSELKKLSKYKAVD